MLTPKQKKIVWVGIACLCLLVLYVPWKKEYRGGLEDATGYSLIFVPPKTEHWGVKVDLPRIILPMFVVICATIAAVVLTGNPQPSKSEMRPPARGMDIYKSAVLTLIAFILAGIWLNTPFPVRVHGGAVDVENTWPLRVEVDKHSGSGRDRLDSTLVETRAPRKGEQLWDAFIAFCSCSSESGLPMTPRR